MLTPAQAERLDAAEIDYRAIPELPDDFWECHPPAARQGKRLITQRLDADVLDFFQASGLRYQTRLNSVLRTYVDDQLHRPRARRHA